MFRCTQESHSGYISSHRYELYAQETIYTSGETKHFMISDSFAITE